MKLIKQSWSWVQKPVLPLEIIEAAGRTCYKSESKITDESSEKFARMILKHGHHSVIEHVSASVRLITNRGVTHELVRHRIAAFSQESTRYVNYGGSDIQFIEPVWYEDSTPNTKIGFLNACRDAETHYKDMLRCGWRPEQAREVLPNSLKTEIVMTANLREWRHVFNLRTSQKAHPQIRVLTQDVLSGFKKEIPVIFDDIEVK